LVLTNGDPDDAVDHLTWHQDQISSFAGTKIAPQRHRDHPVIGEANVPF